MWNVDAKHSENDMKTIVWTVIIFIVDVRFYIYPGYCGWGLDFNLLGCKGCGTSSRYYRKFQLFIGLLRTRHFCCFIESVWCVRLRVCGARVLACV